MKQTIEYIRGVVELIIAQYKFHVQNKDCGLQSILQIENGFRVELWYGDPSDCEFEKLTVSDQMSLLEIEQLINLHLDSY